MINLLIFLGLLGTFYGLAITVPEVVNTIKSLVPKEGQTAIEVFDNLMEGLEGQLGGMGTAFASSLLGLAGSLVVGLLELFAGHGQNRFYMQLEEWLSSFTSIGIFGEGDAGNSNNSTSNFGPLIAQLGQQVSSLSEIVETSEKYRSKTDEQIKKLKNIIREYFFINIFYTKFLKKKSPPTKLGEILNFYFYPYLINAFQTDSLSANHFLAASS